jgi:hypothetical protein
MMFYYLCREAPNNTIRAFCTRRSVDLPHEEFATSNVFMIMKSEEEFIDHWMYVLPNGTPFYLAPATTYEYDMMDAVNIPSLDPDSDFAFARGWSRNTRPPPR